MKIAVLGAGSWGTALAKVLVENGHEAILWGNEPDAIEVINRAHINPNYLPGVLLPPALKASLDLNQVLSQTQMILVVLPTRAIRSVMQLLSQQLHLCQTNPIIVHATKGIEQGTHLRVSQIITQELDRSCYQDVVVLSGPSHAEEVARQDLTTITAASQAIAAAKCVQDVFMNDYFRVYTNQDVIGVELGAALKNIIALGAGILSGAGYGDNAKAALLTRGLAEISRLGIAMGADPLTFAGLSGVGDLVVTCTSQHSRNWQAGCLLAKGHTRDQVEQEIRMVVEGITTCHAAYELAQELGVEMPITTAIYRLLYQDTKQDIQTILKQLMNREGKAEASLKTTNTKGINEK